MKNGTTNAENLSVNPLILISPNPFNDLLNIKLRNSDTEFTKITLVNPIGQVLRSEKISLYHEESISLDMQNMKAGVYFLILEESDGSRYIENIVKQ